MIKQQRGFQLTFSTFLPNIMQNGYDIPLTPWDMHGDSNNIQMLTIIFQPIAQWIWESAQLICQWHDKVVCSLNHLQIYIQSTDIP